MPEWGAYTYTFNNPIRFVDPDGRNPAFSLLLWKATGYIMERYGPNAKFKTIGYSMNHPINAVRTGTADIPTWGISKIASNFEVNLRNEADFAPGEGGQGNAYRHALWQSLLTKEFDENHALRIGNAHEDNLPKDMEKNCFENMAEADQMVDLLNNIIGRDIGSENKNATNKELAIITLKEFKDSGLWTVTGNKNEGYVIQKTRLSQEQYDAALKVLSKKGEKGLEQ